MVSWLVTAAKRAVSVPEPLKCWCLALRGMPKAAPALHSKVCLAPLGSSMVGGAAAGDDVDVLVVEVLLDVELTAGFDLGDVGAEVVALAREVDVCAAAAEAGPGFDLAVDAVHAVLFQDGHALAADELGVWVALVVGSDEVRVCLPVVVRLWCRGHLASSLRVVVPGVDRCVKPGYVWAFSAASAAWWKSSSTSWMMGLKPWAVYCAAPVRRRLP